MSPDPKFSVCEITTFPKTFEQDVDAYVRGGAEGIGLFEPKIEALSDEQVATALRDSGLQPSAGVTSMISILPVPGFEGPTDPQERIDSLCESVRRYGRLGSIGSFCNTGGQGDYGEAEAREIIVDGLRQISRAAAEAGIEFGIEPLSSIHFSDWTTVYGIADTIELMEEVGEPNLKFMFDVWHCWNEPGVEDLIRTHCDRFMNVVHIDDWREETRGWNDRVLPGEGTLDLVGMFRALIEGGYEGWYDLEVFSDDGTMKDDYPDSVWKRDPVEVIAEAKAGFLRAWNEAAESAA